MQVSDAMVDRFLTWRLPGDFMPDGGVSFVPVNHPNAWPIGTNLLTATQARAMLEHVLRDDDEMYVPEGYHCVEDADGERFVKNE